MDEDRISSSVLNELFLALHYAVEECNAERFSKTDLEATRDKVFSKYQAAYRMSDVPTGSPEGIAKQYPSAKNQSLLLIQINGLIDELDRAMSANSAAHSRTDVHTQRWLIYIRDRLKTIVKAVAVDTNEERTTASPALHGGETRERI